MDPTAEDSVVVSIRELKRISTERSTRERAARREVAPPSEDTRRTPAPRRTFEARLPGTVPLARATGATSTRKTGTVHALPAPRTSAVVKAAEAEATIDPSASAADPAPATAPAAARASFAMNAADQAPGRPAAWMSAVDVPAPFAGMIDPPRSRTAAGPVLVTVLLLGAAAGAGYFKLQEQAAVALASKEAAALAAQEGAKRAQEAAVRAEQKVKALEERLQSATAAVSAPAGAATAPAAGGIATPAAPRSRTAPAAPAGTAARPAAAKRHERARPRPARVERPARAAAGEQPAEESAKSGVPSIARRRHMSDDPLAGTRL